MRQILRALAFLVMLLPGVAWAQCNSSTPLPVNTVLGRLGVTSGPCQAIPFATLLSNLPGAQSANKVYASAVSGAGLSLPAFRALVGADLPAPGASSLGGVQSLTCSTSNWFNTLSTAGALGCSQPAFSDISGTIAASQLPNPSASTKGGVKSLAAVSHNFLTAIGTDGTPAQAQPACADVSDASVYCNAARGQLPGESSTGSASSGNVGEYTEGVVASGSAVSVSTATAKTVASISLGAGDWDVSGNVSWITTGSTSVSGTEVSLSGTTNTLDQSAGKWNGRFFPTLVPGAGSTFGETVGPFRMSLSTGPTTVFLVQETFFSASTLTAYGTIRARRVR